MLGFTSEPLFFFQVLWLHNLSIKVIIILVLAKPQNDNVYGKWFLDWDYFIFSSTHLLFLLVIVESEYIRNINELSFHLACGFNFNCTWKLFINIIYIYFLDFLLHSQKRTRNMTVNLNHIEEKHENIQIRYFKH